MSLLQNTAYGGIMILAVAVLRRVLKDKLVPEARLALWAVCLFRLLTPAAPESVLSLWGLLGRDVQDIPVSGPDVLAPVSGGTFAPAVQMGTALAPVEGGNPWGTVLAAVWVIVGAALAARFALSYLRTRRAVRCAIPLGRDDPRYAPLPKCARLREGSMDGAPLTFGAVRPTVVLTPGLSGEKLVCVLAHEAVHAKRRDNLWHYVMAAALAVHWWNPAVWLMSRLLRRDIELACDRAAVKKLGAEKRAEYASALLAMAASGSGPAFCQMFGRKAAEERILSVMKFKKTTIFGAVLTVLLVVGVTVAFASSPKTEMPDEDSTTSSAPAGRLPDEVSAYIEKLSAGMSRESVHALMGEPSFSMSSPVFSDSYELDDTHKPQVGIFYDVDGAVTQVKYFSDGTDPDCVGIDLTPYLSGSASTVEFHGRTYDRADLSAETLEWLDWYLGLTEEEQLAVSSVPPGLQDGLDFGTEDAEQAVPEFVPDDDPNLEDSAGAGGEPAISKLGNDYYDYSMVDSSGTAAAGAVVCADPACPVSGGHHHEGDTVVHHYNTAPALLDVCPVEGCTVRGAHTHDGVAYRCNGAHCGGVCDGSCNVYFSGGDSAPAGVDSPIACPPETIDQNFPSRTNCYPDANGHHSEGHHGGHH